MGEGEKHFLQKKRADFFTHFFLDEKHGIPFFWQNSEPTKQCMGLEYFIFGTIANLDTNQDTTLLNRCFSRKSFPIRINRI